MEYVEGYDLNALLRTCTKKRVPLPLEYALLIVIETLRGLDYAHRREDDAGAPMGIVHRDVSPSNILVSLEGEVKVCDFGIAHANAMVATSDQAWEDALRGKCGYMSPTCSRPAFFSGSWSQANACIVHRIWRPCFCWRKLE
jgi:eukaryotic-like serine/threonine-protein kinase